MSIVLRAEYPNPEPRPSRRAFLRRLSVVFGAVALAPGLSILENTPVGFHDFTRIGVSFEVMKDGGWFHLGTITHLEPPSLNRVKAEETIGKLEIAPLRMVVNDVPILVNVVGSTWFGHVTKEPEIPPSGATLYRTVFPNGDAFFFPARTARA